MEEEIDEEYIPEQISPICSMCSNLKDGYCQAYKMSHDFISPKANKIQCKRYND